MERLLRVLADGEFHSGAALGEHLGVSRTAVWKQLKKLAALGIELHSVKGRGYRIPAGLDLLDMAELRAALTPEVAAQLRQVSLVLSTASTSADALQAAQSGERQGCLYLAEQQTAGRGRRGRPWVSPFGRNLYFSLAWTFAGGAAALEGLSLVVGLAVRQGLLDCGVAGLQLKWPNDLLRDGRKLAGILLEMSGDASGLCQVVIGVGVNVTMPAAVAASIDQPWADLSDGAAQLGRNRLLAAILNRLLPLLQRFSATGFAPFRAEWEACSAYAGKPVVLTTPRHRFTGICRGVDASGALLVEGADGVEAFHGGELSVRGGDDS